MNKRFFITLIAAGAAAILSSGCYTNFAEAQGYSPVYETYVLEDYDDDYEVSVIYTDPIIESVIITTPRMQVWLYDPDLCRIYVRKSYHPAVLGFYGHSWWFGHDWAFGWSDPYVGWHVGYYNPHHYWYNPVMVWYDRHWYGDRYWGGGWNNHYVYYYPDRHYNSGGWSHGRTSMYGGDRRGDGPSRVAVAQNNGSRTEPSRRISRGRDQVATSQPSSQDTGRRPTAGRTTTIRNTQNTNSVQQPRTTNRRDNTVPVRITQSSDSHESGNGRRENLKKTDARTSSQSAAVTSRNSASRTNRLSKPTPSSQSSRTSLSSSSSRDRSSRFTSSQSSGTLSKSNRSSTSTSKKTSTRSGESSASSKRSPSVSQSSANTTRSSSSSSSPSVSRSSGSSSSGQSSTASGSSGSSRSSASSSSNKSSTGSRSSSRRTR